MSPPADARPIRVAYFDGAVAYGGSLQVLSMLLSSVEREAIGPSLIACVPREQLLGKFADQDIALLFKVPLSYVVRERWMNRIASCPTPARKLGSYVFSAVQAFSGLANQVRLFWHLIRQRPDVLHINNSFTPLLAAHLLNIPVIWHLHGVPFRPSPWERYLLKKIHRFVAISQYVANSAIKTGYPAERMEVIFNPAPEFPDSTSELFRSQLLKSHNIPREHKLIAHIGRLIRWKGQLEFLRAFKLLASAHADVTAFIVGDDAEAFNGTYKRELEEFVDTAGLRERVIFTGHVANPQQLMAAVDLVVHSSIEPEPFGLIIVEAMQAGTPIVASRLGAPVELIQEGVTGFLASPTTPDELFSKMQTAICDKEQAQKIAATAKSHSQEKFSIANFSKKLETLYKQATRQPKTTL